MNESITQEDDFGCGAAYVAFVAQKPYSAITALLGQENAKTKGYYCRELVDVLAGFGLAYTYHYLKLHKADLAYLEGSIVFLKRSKKYPSGHYIVRYRGKWMDSWINFVSNKNIVRARSGYRQRIPGIPQYVLYETCKNPCKSTSRRV